MKLAISESEKCVSEDQSVRPLVGAVIVDENGKVVAKAYRNEQWLSDREIKGDHAEYIAIEKAIASGYSDFSKATIYATLEPCTHRGHNKTPCARRIVEAGFRNVYIGALDPNPRIVGHGETYLRERMENVERFPSHLEREIRRLNVAFWQLFISDHLPSNSLYQSVRVSDVVLTKLRANGVDLRQLPTESVYSLSDLAALIHGKGLFKADASKLRPFLEEARAAAFDEKYSNYTYDNDARKVEQRWLREFPGIMKRFRVYDYPKRHIVNVGIGNGLEGVGLFDECDHFIGVDIAPDSLARAKSRLSRATFFRNSAEDLRDIADDSQDIYVSLRTYQSAFFDVPAAIREAHRVLAPGGLAVVSVSNAYLHNNSFIKGMLPHGSTIVDQDIAHKVAAEIRLVLQKLGFEDVGVHSGRAEEYVFGKRRF